MSSGIYSSNFGRGVTWDAKKKTPQGGSWQMKVFVGPDPRASRWGSIPRFHRKKLDLVSPSWFLFGDVESLHLHPKETKDIPNISKEKSSFEPTKFGGKKLCVWSTFFWLDDSSHGGLALALESYRIASKTRIFPTSWLPIQNHNHKKPGKHARRQCPWKTTSNMLGMTPNAQQRHLFSPFFPKSCDKNGDVRNPSLL